MVISDHPEYQVEKLEKFKKNFVLHSQSIDQPSDDHFESSPQSTFYPFPFTSSYAAAAYKTCSLLSQDAASLKLAANLMTSKYLLKNIREKNGAYGAGARYSPLSGIFSFYSYRDPKPFNSVRVFEDAVKWILQAEYTNQVNFIHF